MLYTGGLEVYTSINIPMQQAAEIAVRQNLRNHDKRQGYRGPMAQLDEAGKQAFLDQQEQTLADQPLKVGSLQEALVTGGDTEKIFCRLGRREGIIDIKARSWASPISVVARDVPPSGNSDGGLASHIPVDSVVQVEVTEIPENGPLGLSLDQSPLAQGALIASDPETGQIKAMVGGYDFNESQFNRAIQAKRLPGSAIKPIIYAAALDKGYTPASVILDTPLIYEEIDKQGVLSAWKPRNYEEKFYGPTSFRQALTHSRNVVTIKILEDIGVSYVARYARKLGIQTPLTRDLTLALGSTAVTPIEMLNAYTVFANGGIRVSPSYINKIVDRNGRTLESIDPADFATGIGPDQRLIRKPPRRVITAETAYLITNMMESVVQEGTGGRAKALGRPVAGKTGTTNDLKDAWFIGFIPQLACVSWVGYDQEKPLGRSETGARAAAPAWVEFMLEAVKQYPARDFKVPDDIEFYPIEEKTGKLLLDDDPQARIEAFAPGTAPTELANTEETPKASDFFRLDL
jgi:penicillin-binding protein 1A